jgi:hypothetical protein
MTTTNLVLNVNSGRVFIQLGHFQTSRTLRIFLGHTVSGQVWQTGTDAGEGANFETGEGIPAWAFKIEGRLLEVRTNTLCVYLICVDETFGVTDA